MQILVVASVILLAIFLGAAIPVLLQLRSTLQSAQKVMDEVGPQLKNVLEEAAHTTERINRMAAEIEERAKKAEPIVDAALDIGNQVVRLGGSIRTAMAIGTALGPAVSAAVRAFIPKTDGTDGTDGTE